MRKFYDLAIEQGWTQDNPASQVQLLGEVASERTHFLTADDLRQLLDAVRQAQPRRAQRDWAIILVLLQSGLKLKELTELCLPHLYLDSEPPCIAVPAGSGEPGRLVPLQADVFEGLCAYLPHRRAAPGVDRVFVNRDGNPMSTRSVQRLLRYYARAAGLDKLTTQALRYVYAKETFERSGDLKAVGQLLGHRHLATTIRYLRPCAVTQSNGLHQEEKHATEL
jgi:integrase/recombinase XerC